LPVASCGDADRRPSSE